MRCCGEKVIIEDRQIASLLVKESIREVDAEVEESNCMSNEFEDKAHLKGKKARMSIKKTQLSASKMKCYHGRNHNGERDT